MAEDSFLDIPEAQLLIWLEEDADDVHWHHHICFVRAGGPGRWIALDPDLRLRNVNFADSQLQVLSHSSVILDLGDEEAYLHDALSRAELDGYTRRAKLQARLLADEDEVVIVSDVWVVAGPG